MKRTILVAALSLAAAAPAFAQGASQYSPGQQMQERGSYKNTPGASGYAPGQVMHRKRARTGTTGASGYAPGHKKKKSKSH